MAGLINWKKVAIPTASPDGDHLYVGVDPSDCKLYIKDDTGTVFKYQTDANVTTAINAALVDYDLSTVVDSKISSAISGLIDGAPAALDTLNEIAAALADDANFAATITTALAGKQPLDGDLTAIAALAGAGFAVRTTTNTWATRSIVAGAGVGVTNSDGVFGSPTISNSDRGTVAVTAHEALPDPHPQYLTSTEGDTLYQPLDSDLTALASNTGTGILVRTGSGTVATRFIAVSTGLGSSAPDGVSGNPTIFNSDTGSSAVSTHVGLPDPHAQYALETDVTTLLSGKENTITAGTTSQYWRGDKTFQDLPTAVRLVLLTGLSLVDAAVSAADTVLGALGKLQGQLNQRVSDFNAAQAVQDGRLDVLEATDAEWTELVTVGDLTNNSSTTFTNITALQFTVTAGLRYYFEYTLSYESVAGTTGLVFDITAPAGVLAAQVNIPIAADGTAALFTGSITSSGDIVTSTGTPTANNEHIATIRGSFVCTTTGTLVPQFRSENNGSQITLRQGSYLLSREF